MIPKFYNFLFYSRKSHRNTTSLLQDPPEDIHGVTYLHSWSRALFKGICKGKGTSVDEERASSIFHLSQTYLIHLVWGSFSYNFTSLTIRPLPREHSPSVKKLYQNVKASNSQMSHIKLISSDNANFLAHNFFCFLLLSFYCNSTGKHSAGKYNIIYIIRPNLLYLWKISTWSDWFRPLKPYLDTHLNTFFVQNKYCGLCSPSLLMKVL